MSVTEVALGEITGTPGQCSCPTNEYEKVEAMDLDPSDDGIAIRLHAKPGQEFDTDEIATCLEYTVSRTSPPS